MKQYSNWGSKHKNRRRCNCCGQRVTLYIYEEGGKRYCKCPKCLQSAPYNKRIRLRVKFI